MPSKCRILYLILLGLFSSESYAEDLILKKTSSHLSSNFSFKNRQVNHLSKSAKRPLEKSRKIANNSATLTEAGKDLYSIHCLSCHGEKGEGVEGLFPPLAKSDYLMKSVNRTIDIIINGLGGPIVVNGTKYDKEMQGVNLTDKEVSLVLTT